LDKGHFPLFLYFRLFVKNDGPWREFEQLNALQVGLMGRLMLFDLVSNVVLLLEEGCAHLIERVLLVIHHPMRNSHSKGKLSYWISR
jgi:hypothetical protein